MRHVLLVVQKAVAACEVGDSHTIPGIIGSSASYVWAVIWLCRFYSARAASSPRPSSKWLLGYALPHIVQGSTSVRLPHLVSFPLLLLLMLFILIGCRRTLS